SMHLLYPELISARTPCTPMNSVEGRPIYYVKITNQNLTDPKPKVLYDALTHAREPMGMQQLIFYMWYLLENYNTNEEVKYLVDNLELYFVPVVNVDGYEYNYTTFPNGGGDWRKNRRDNGGSFGIDLNRNFGYMWGYDDIGSSPIPSELTYRGPFAFSEPETQIIRDFSISNGFRQSLNYHTYSNLFLYPWCYITEIAPDSAILVNYSTLMTRMNRYTTGTPGDVLYNTNGDINDWMYGEQTTKPKIFSFTAEIGNQQDGFWPAPWRIITLCQENMYQNLMMAHLALKYAEATDRSPAIMQQREGFLAFNFERYGLESPGTYTVSVEPLDPTQMIQTGPEKTYTNPGQLTITADSIAYTLAPDFPVGGEFRYILKCFNGLYTFSDTITKWFGPELTVFSDDCNQFTNWTSVKWNVTNTSYFSPTGSITDSPSGNYSNNANSPVTTIGNIDLKDSPIAVLTYEAKWNLENTYDYVQIGVSNTTGGTFIPQEGRYTKNGSENEDQGKPVYDGKQGSWVKEQVVLTDFMNSDIKVRFTLKSDQGTVKDGFYFDDFTVKIIDMSGVGIVEKQHSTAYLSDPIPNPASVKTTIRYDFGNMEPLTFSMFDAQGKEILRKTLSEKQGEVDLSLQSFAPGVYFYRIHSAEGNSEMKKLMIIKQN
ncbi:MAG TPA: M14 family zinc carboxypeptidase, partial [Bacteroidales bacterium]|nr:M14 family zinc carboxypeptidase [Bacteroidales bacterium]